MKALISIPQQRRAAALEKSLYALVRGQTSPRRNERLAAAKMVYADDKAVAAIIERADAPVGTTTGTGWSAELSPSLVYDFVATLAPLSAAAALIEQGVQVMLDSASEMKIPAREGGPSTTVAWVGEEEPIPVRQYAVNQDAVLAPRKTGFIVGLTRELAKRANGEAVVRTLIREDAAATLDGAYFSAVAGTSTAHAGMLNGVTPLTGFAGGDRLALETDLAALSDVVAAAGSGTAAFVVSPGRAARLRIIAPDLTRELTFLPSLAVAAGDIIAVDPLSWIHGFGSDFDIDASRVAVLHMENENPLEIVSGTGPTTADPVRAAWQTDAIALRLLVDVAFAPRRPNAIAWATGLTW